MSGLLSDVESLVYTMSNVPLSEYDMKECSNCKLQTELVGDEYICPNCDRICGIRDRGSDYVLLESGYTTTGCGSAIYVRLSGYGKEASAIQKTLQKITIMDRYDIIKQHAIKHIKKYAYINHIDIPSDILDIVINNYYMPLITAKNKTYRYPVREGIFIACIYFAYRADGHPKTTTEIKALFTKEDGTQIEDMHIASGIREVQSTVKIPETVIGSDTTTGYIDQIVAKHNITDPLHIMFMHELSIAICPRTMGCVQFRPQTKSVGIVYLYSLCMGIEIQPTEIIQTTTVAQNSLTRVVKAIVSCLKNPASPGHTSIVDIFTRYGIPIEKLISNKEKKRRHKKSIEKCDGFMSNMSNMSNIGMAETQDDTQPIIALK
jgi:transcription initiation factor TFIIIB Brf1 subunit/transcription initiation factor TFIIB